MIDRERAQKEIEAERELKLKESAWDGPSGGGFLPKINQRAAARALQIKDLEKQSSRNASPSGVRDRPSSVLDYTARLNVEDKLKLSREGRVRRTGEGLEEATELVLHIKKRVARGNAKFKLTNVEKRLLQSPLTDSFHGKSRSGSRAKSRVQLYDEDIDYEEENDQFYGMIPPLSLFHENERVVMDQREHFELID
jgi:hypothetical protein